MKDISTVIIAILVFGFLIFIHELGHFLAARWAGVRVNEFALGMGPVIFQKTVGETAYSLRLFPIGGYVAMEGEDESSSHEDAFNRKKPWKRLIILLAGAVMNLILGYLIVVGLVIDSGSVGTTIIADFWEESTSIEYLMAEDEIVKVNGTTTKTPNDITFEFMRDTDGLVDMEVIRDGQLVVLDAVPFKMEEIAEGVSAIAIDFRVYSKELAVGDVITYSFNWAVTIAKQVWVSLVDLITGRFGFNQLSGPVGVATAIGESASMGLSSLMLMVAFITINLGVFNLLPLPALDGGRIVFIIIEMIIGKPVKPEYEGYIHTGGLLLLLTLMVVVTFNDIVKLVGGFFS